MFIFGFMYLVFILVLFVFGVLWYIARAFATCYMLKEAGSDKPWAGWVPVYNYIACAEVVAEADGNIEVFNRYRVNNILVGLVPLIGGMLSAVPYIGVVIAFASCGLYGYYVLAPLFAMESGKSEDSLRVLGVVAGMIDIVYIIYSFMRKFSNKE